MMRKIIATPAGASNRVMGGYTAAGREWDDYNLVSEETSQHEHLADLIDSQTARGFVLAQQGRIDGPTSWRAQVRSDVAISNLFA